ncbi:hypothetical protein TGAM01_v206451 [Trichoderma gamsii]|uniref:Uncharacterized protein n=1 Tax=Trichoderma gamsii TaxID=398673 RepID=A0A2P4ZJP4_9HYPO|nr:hypothetical protein TGAM01_v206451 [Trichoderma gamsii]PON24521.1 hypothetical protein TGAM01_v206451 [Trichoderma gamsii]
MASLHLHPSFQRGMPPVNVKKDVKESSNGQYMYNYRLHDASTSTAASMYSCLSSFIKYRYSCQVQRAQSVHGHAACEALSSLAAAASTARGSRHATVIAGLARAHA